MGIAVYNLETTKEKEWERENSVRMRQNKKAARMSEVRVNEGKFTDFPVERNSKDRAGQTRSESSYEFNRGKRKENRRHEEKEE